MRGRAGSFFEGVFATVLATPAIASRPALRSVSRSRNRVGPFSSCSPSRPDNLAGRLLSRNRPGCSCCCPPWMVRVKSSWVSFSRHAAFLLAVPAPSAASKRTSDACFLSSSAWPAGSKAPSSSHCFRDVSVHLAHARPRARARRRLLFHRRKICRRKASRPTPKRWAAGSHSPAIA